MAPATRSITAGGMEGLRPAHLERFSAFQSSWLRGQCGRATTRSALVNCVRTQHHSPPALSPSRNVSRSVPASQCDSHTRARVISRPSTSRPMMTGAPNMVVTRQSWRMGLWLMTSATHRRRDQRDIADGEPVGELGQSVEHHRWLFHARPSIRSMEISPQVADSTETTNPRLVPSSFPQTSVIYPVMVTGTRWPDSIALCKRERPFFTSIRANPDEILIGGAMLGAFMGG